MCILCFVFNTGFKSSNINKYGKFDIKVFKNKLDGSEHYAIIKGKFIKNIIGVNEPHSIITLNNTTIINFEYV